MPKNEIVELHGKFMFNLIRNCQTIFHSDCTISHSHQQCVCILITLHPHQYLILSFVIFVIFRVILVGMQWHLLMVLIFFYILPQNISSFDRFHYRS